MKPIIVTDLDMAFGGKIKELLPAYDKIPNEFKNGNGKWNRVVSDWFFLGLKDCKWTPKEGVNTSDALRHIKAVMASWEPKHEHKEAGCAYLLSEFFDDVTYKTVR